MKYRYLSDVPTRKLRGWLDAVVTRFGVKCTTARTYMRELARREVDLEIALREKSKGVKNEK